MPEYYGRCEKLKKLARTRISQGAFDFVVEVGYDSMKDYIKRGAKDVISLQFSIWFNRVPDLLGEFQQIYNDEWRDIYTHGIDKKRTIESLIREPFQFIADVIGSRDYLIILSGPLFLKNLFKRIKKDDIGFNYSRSLLDNCQGYFDEISRYMDFAEAYY